MKCVMFLTGVLAIVIHVVAGELDLSECFPPNVKTIGVIMPASILAKEKFDRGVRALEKAGYRIKLAPRLKFDKIAPLDDRVKDFEEAWLDPEVDLVLCARGGSGAEDVVNKLDWQRLAQRPNQRLLGFSNITMILNAMLKKGVGHPFSGPTISQMLYASGGTFAWLCRAIAGEPQPSTRLRALKAGAFSGLPCGGHIHYVQMGACGGWGADMRGRVVFLERNPSATMDMVRKELDAIVASGCLEGAAGVIFGDLTLKADEKHISKADLASAAEELKRAFVAQVKCPVYDGYAYGHIPESHTIDFRRVANVSKDGLLTWK